MQSGETGLVTRLCSDDPTALEEAYQRYAARCKAVAYRILADEMRAEDAVQEAFLALWRHRAGLVVRTAGIAPWLITVTRNAALSALRARTRAVERESRLELASEPADPAQLVAAGAEANAVREALSSLPDEQRNVIEMAYFGLLTLSQIANRTGAPLGTVKRRAQLGLRRLALAVREGLQ